MRPAGLIVFFCRARRVLLFGKYPGISVVRMQKEVCTRDVVAILLCIDSVRHELL